uniref:Uncharacterized protein n=1 Tax=Palpitomonas bilix TaxID=652834 RepID=A0A7S3GI82_9EUKA
MRSCVRRSSGISEEEAEAMKLAASLADNGRRLATTSGHSPTHHVNPVVCEDSSSQYDQQEVEDSSLHITAECRGADEGLICESDSESNGGRTASPRVGRDDLIETSESDAELQGSWAHLTTSGNDFQLPKSTAVRHTVFFSCFNVEFISLSSPFSSLSLSIL